eukprot:TRINITY_DN42738_c0_g1_i1.p1 TRINITY_DN42738_c0_g1~~TRINITY_DN42738_c0_g1_i1.p1  ORF type:complete len:410 (-),score=74.03 TRINITY_DN42738_c0_g1_i1:305-1534(-)
MTSISWISMASPAKILQSTDAFQMSNPRELWLAAKWEAQQCAEEMFESWRMITRSHQARCRSSEQRRRLAPGQLPPLPNTSPSTRGGPEVEAMAAGSPGALSPKLKVADLTGKVAIITGSTRGIGKACAEALAKQGCNIVVAAKTTKPEPTLPGTIYSVAEELEQLGVQALPVKVDMRNLDDVKECVRLTVEKFGRIDILINNASALWWQRIEDTPMNKYDLITQINARGSFAMTSLCLPVMAKNGFGRVITMSPPIKTHFREFAGFTAYNISKFGMTMCAMGAAAEYEGKGITGHSLWPATVVESQASKNFELGGREMWRKAQILSDCVLGLVSAPDSYTGQQLIDDEYLMDQHGFTGEDLAVYRCVPDVEPPRALASREMGGTTVRRGDVRKLEDDHQKSSSTLSKL